MSRVVLVAPAPIGPVVRRFEGVEQALKAVVWLMRYMAECGALKGDEGVSAWGKTRTGWERIE